GPPAVRAGRSGAASGRIVLQDRAKYQTEVDRAFELLKPLQGPNVNVGIDFVAERGADNPAPAGKMDGFLLDLVEAAGQPVGDRKTRPDDGIPTDLRKNFDPTLRQKRQFDQLVAFTQKLWRQSDLVRKQYWAK